MSSTGVSSVDSYTIKIERLLERSHDVKPDGGVEPSLALHDFDGGIEEVRKQNWASSKNYAAIETACRNIFYDLLASTSIGDPSFGGMWNLLDILSILSDLEICEPGLLFWLIEELLDTQTINGCRTVFDYLDSRRERITAKHFEKKKFIILRACNELLRRLSRAEDTVFCGRVFVFLFQGFPLGDRSSVNLRGEYHVENVTAFEELPPKSEPKPEDGMELDTKEGAVSEHKDAEQDDATVTEEPLKMESGSTWALSKTVKFDSLDESLRDGEHDLDALYPIFWSLQENFSTPTILFDDAKLQALKSGLNSTMQTFKGIQQELQARGTSKLPDESKRGMKRKRNGIEDDFSGSFNPKYLTSRDLFDLEISDLAFRRHILVQALILIDFLLSLTPKSKKKLEHTTNKSVLYNYTLSDENAKWANTTRSEIAAYLQQGPEGKFYYRMVDTVLSRDKNWVHWKAEGCPPIARDRVSAKDFWEAEKGAQKACANKKLRTTPIGSLDLRFLSDGGDAEGMEKLKNPERYSIPAVESFKGPIAEDDMNLEMARTDEERQQATAARASKLWRTLRIASKSRLNMFDKIEDGNNLQALFQQDTSDREEIRGKTETDGPDVKTVAATKNETASETGQDHAYGMGIDTPREMVVK